MGALVTKATRPIKAFNIENRARRVISKEKPTRAPIYAKNLEDLKRTLEADPNIDEKLNTKNIDLDNRLRDVYVTSMGKPEDDITLEKRRSNPNRPLPEIRTQPEDYEFGFKEPEKVTYGRTTMRHVLDFITAHQANPKEVTPAKIALEYKLKLEDVENIVKHFKTFELYIPKTKTSPAVFAGPGTSRKQLEEVEHSTLADNLNEKDKIKVNEQDSKEVLGVVEDSLKHENTKPKEQVSVSAQDNEASDVKYTRKIN